MVNNFFINSSPDTPFLNCRRQTHALPPPLENNGVVLNRHRQGQKVSRWQRESLREFKWGGRRFNGV